MWITEGGHLLTRYHAPMTKPRDTTMVRVSVKAHKVLAARAKKEHRTIRGAIDAMLGI